jgi:hypothetical protein
MDAFNVSVLHTGEQTPGFTRKMRQFIGDIRRSGPPGDGTTVAENELVEGKTGKLNAIKLTQRAGPLVALPSGETRVLGKTLPQLRRVVWETNDEVVVFLEGQPTARYLAWIIESLHRNILDGGDWQVGISQDRFTELKLTKVK